MSGTKIKLVVDLATDRIVWFGPVDFPLEETHIDGAAIAYCDGPTPVGMRAANAWNYKLVNQKIVPPAPKQPRAPESSLEASRIVVLKQINQAVDKYRAAHGVPQSVAEYLLLDSEAMYAATVVTKRSETVRLRYIDAVRATTSSTGFINMIAELNRELNEIQT